MIRFSVIVLSGLVMLTSVAAEATTITKVSISLFGEVQDPKGGLVMDSRPLAELPPPAGKDGLIRFTARGGSLSASGFTSLNYQSQVQGEGFAHFFTDDLRFFQTTTTPGPGDCGLNCFEIQVIFRMRLTGSITQGDPIQGFASAYGLVYVVGEHLRDAGSNRVFEVTNRHDVVSSKDGDREVDEDLSVVFRVRAGDTAENAVPYQVAATLWLSIGAAKDFFGRPGFVTADFGNTFEVDPYRVFELPDGYSAEAPSLGLINNQIPALFPQAVPTPATLALFAPLLGLVQLTRWRRDML